MRASGWLLVLLAVGCGDCDVGSGGRAGDEPGGDEDGFTWPGDGRAGGTARLGDSGRTLDAGGDGGASADASAPSQGVDSGGGLADAGGREDSGASAGGTGGDTCDNDRDQDGVCNADDHCLGNGAEDSDGDYACDGDDLCAGHDDRIDEDEDSAPDGCDTCPIGNDSEDEDEDGFADLCDQVLWDRPFDGAASFPYVAPRVALIAHKEFEPDVVYAEVDVALQASAGFTVTETGIADLIAALNISGRVLRTEFRYGSPSAPTSTFVTAATDESPVNGLTPVWRRIVVRGSIVGATNNFIVELRGYDP